MSCELGRETHLETDDYCFVSSSSRPRLHHDCTTRPRHGQPIPCSLAALPTLLSHRLVPPNRDGCSHCPSGSRTATGCPNRCAVVCAERDHHLEHPQHPRHGTVSPLHQVGSGIRIGYFDEGQTSMRAKRAEGDDTARRGEGTVLMHDGHAGLEDSRSRTPRSRQQYRITRSCLATPSPLAGTTLGYSE